MDVRIIERHSQKDYKWQPFFLRMEIMNPSMLKEGWEDDLKRTFKPGSEREKVVDYWNFAPDTKLSLMAWISRNCRLGDWQWFTLDDNRVDHGYKYDPEGDLRRAHERIRELEHDLYDYRSRGWENEDRITELREELRKSEEKNSSLVAAISAMRSAGFSTGREEEFEEQIKVLKNDISILLKEKNGLLTQLNNARLAADLFKNMIGAVKSGSSSTGAHATLFVSNDAPPEVIKAAYRALSMLHHPDKGGDVRKMQEINQAYEKIGR